MPTGASGYSRLSLSLCLSPPHPPSAYRFLLMCVVLRCCSDSESQSIFDLEEINLAAGFNHKPTAIVDGQPVSEPEALSTLSDKYGCWQAPQIGTNGHVRRERARDRQCRRISGKPSTQTRTLTAPVENSSGICMLVSRGSFSSCGTTAWGALEDTFIRTSMECICCLTCSNPRLSCSGKGDVHGEAFVGLDRNL